MSSMQRIILVLVIINLLCCNHKKREAEAKLEEANLHLKNGRFDKALDDSYYIIKALPNDPAGYIISAQALYQLDRFAEAKVQLQKALQFDPDNTSVLFHLGLNCYHLNEHTQALNFYNRAIKTKGSDTLFIEFKKSSTLKEIGRYDIPMATIRYFRGLAYYYLTNYNSALDDLLFALQNNYNKPNCFFYIGIISQDKGNITLACKYFNLAYDEGYIDAVSYLNKYCK